MRAIAVVMLLVAARSVPHAGQALAQPAFEVASVRQNTSGANQYSYSPGLTHNLWGELIPLPGPILISNAPLRDIIARAYGLAPNLDRFAVRGGPDRILSARFDIQAKPPEGASPGQTLSMLRNLLAHRFQLKAHTEVADRPTYYLTVAREGRLGSQMKPTSLDCAVFRQSRASDPSLEEPLDADGRRLCRGTVQIDSPAGVQTMTYAGELGVLAWRIQAFLDRPLVDATGLTGNFEWRLSWSTSSNIDAPAPRLARALEEQLGLRLEPRTGPGEVLVIDSVSFPSAN